MEGLLEAFALEMDKSQPVYLYCFGGGRSRRASQLLDSLGFSKIYDYSGHSDWSQKVSKKILIKGILKIYNTAEIILIIIHAPMTSIGTMMISSILNLCTHPFHLFRIHGVVCSSNSQNWYSIQQISCAIPIL